MVEPGDLDATCMLADFPDGYEGLVAGAHAQMIGGITVRRPDVDDVIRSKTAATRPKDLAAWRELLVLSPASAPGETR